jgi:hypothetical protein
LARETIRETTSVGEFNMLSIIDKNKVKKEISNLIKDLDRIVNFHAEHEEFKK